MEVWDGTNKLTNDIPGYHAKSIYGWSIRELTPLSNQSIMKLGIDESKIAMHFQPLVHHPAFNLSCKHRSKTVRLADSSTVESACLISGQTSLDPQSPDKNLGSVVCLE